MKHHKRLLFLTGTALFSMTLLWQSCSFKKTNSTVKQNVQGFIYGIVKFTGLYDSPLEENEETWNDAQSTVRLKGFEVILTKHDSATEEAKTNAGMSYQELNSYSKNIYQYLKGIGFKDDIFNTTEISTALSDKKYFIKIKIDTGKIRVWIGKKQP